MPAMTAGQTAAVRAAVAALDPAGHNVIYIGNPGAGARGYLELPRQLGL